MFKKGVEAIKRKIHTIKKRIRCLRCGYEWVKGKEDSKWCPGCNHPLVTSKPHYRPIVPDGPFDPIPGRDDADYGKVVKALLWDKLDWFAFRDLRESAPELDWGGMIDELLENRDKTARPKDGPDLWGGLTRMMIEEYARWLKNSVLDLQD